MALLNRCSSRAPIAIAKERANREQARREATLANLKQEQQQLQQISRQLENSIIRATSDGTMPVTKQFWRLTKSGILIKRQLKLKLDLR